MSASTDALNENIDGLMMLLLLLLLCVCVCVLLATGAAASGGFAGCHSTP
jgi:hypothetical protein